MKPFVLALQLLGLLQLSKSQSACTPDIATPIDGTTDSGSSSGSGGDPGAAAVASYQVAGASAIVDLTGTNLNSGFSGPADLIDLGSSPPKRKLFLKKRAALDCTSSESCYSLKGDPLCANLQTGDFHLDDGTTGNLNTGDYELPDGRAGNFNNGPYPTLAASTSDSLSPSATTSADADSAVASSETVRSLTTGAVIADQTADSVSTTSTSNGNTSNAPRSSSAQSSTTSRAPSTTNNVAAATDPAQQPANAATLLTSPQSLSLVVLLAIGVVALV